MSSRANGVNRVVLAVLGLLLVAAGVLGLALGAGAFGEERSTGQVLPQEVATFPDERPWFWWAVVGGLLLIAVLALFWLLAQLKTDRATRLDRTTDARDGYTTLHASALIHAVEDEAMGLTGVTGASANLREHGGPHMSLRVELADSANIADVRTRLEDEVVAHLREAVGDSGFPVIVDLRPAATRTRQRSVL
jgi:hypothetical protein